MTERRTFVSYAREDEDFARRLATDLQAAGVNVWIDQLSIEPGAAWDPAVEAALHESDDVLLILSPDSVASTNVMDECSYALDARKRIIPILYRECRIPLRVHRLQRIDFSRSYEEGLARLLAAFGRSSGTVRPTPRPVPEHRPWAVVAAVAVALVVVIVTIVLTTRRHAAPPVTETTITDSATTTAVTTTAPAATATVAPSGNTPDFTPRQGHLDPAPRGVDARYAWSLPGGDGAGVRVAIVTGAARYAHEDLGSASLTGELSDDESWRDHAIATHGIIAAKSNGFGVTGVAPAASVSFQSTIGGSSSRAIVKSAERLRSGDILLVQIGRPRNNARQRLPAEWWPDDFAAIRRAVTIGVIVIEPAGNDGLDLDSRDFDAPDDGFPRGWRNPFGQGATADSGAIFVGAGLPDNLVATRFSNFGSRVNVHAWGTDIVTTGYGDLFGGEASTRAYTAEYSGTSASAAIVAGVLASVQGVLRAKGLAPLTPAEARRLLHETGSRPATPAQGRRIGPRPDLRKLIPAALALRR